MTEGKLTQQSPPYKSSVPTWFLTLVSLPIILGLIWFGRDFLIPLALAALLFILNMALVERLNSAKIAGKKVPRLIAYIAVTALLFLLIAAFGYTAINQANAITEAAPKYSERFSSLKIQAETFIGADQAASIETSIRSVNIGGWLKRFAASAAGVVGNIGLILLYLAFMLAERRASFEKLPRLCSTPESAKHVRDILESISASVRQYMWINTATSALSGTLAFVVMSLLGVDFALPLAFMVFLLNFIPSIGSFLAVLFPTTLALLQFETVVPALIIVVVYGGGDAMIGNILQPRMQGKSLNLSTFVVMVALTFWSMMWGPVGAFIAVPLTVVIMIICSEIPGLEPFARLLSSDGILPKEADSQPTQKEQASTTTGNALTRRASSFAKRLKTSASDTETDTELEVIKQDLLQQKEFQQSKSETSRSTTNKPKPR